MPRHPRSVPRALYAGAVLIVCAVAASAAAPQPRPEPPRERVLDEPAPPSEVVRLAFAGDVHFEEQLRGVLSDPGSTLGPMSDVLAEADLAMVNLESAVTDNSARAPKELEDAADRYWFRTGMRALDVLDRSGVDVVSVANNHGADYGLAGVQDTLRAADDSPVAIVGVGRDERQAFAPHRARVRDTNIAVHAADASPLEGRSATWTAAPGSGPALASARDGQTTQLIDAVRSSAAIDDLVVVYLHWGEEGNASSTDSQESIARMLGRAGADIVVGTHAHTPVGSGMQGDTYVSYGLGNFFWYHGNESETGVLQLDVRGGEVVGESWEPATIRPAGGDPQPLTGEKRTDAVEGWRALRQDTDLAPGPGPLTARATAGGDPALPTFISAISPIGPSVRSDMASHDDARCPVPLADLRHLDLTYVGFDGRAHRGEMIVHADVATDVVAAFGSVYAARFPIDGMRLVDDFGGDDDLSMAANNTSGYNCRRVAGQLTWSDHAFGRAIDINPVQNPYVLNADDVRPPAASRFVDVDRTPNADLAAGVIGEDDPVRRAFDEIGWEWGGLFPDPDFQHFSAPE